MLGGLSGLSGPQYDYAEVARLRAAYVIASTFRSGSSHLAMCLWRTGVLGAPFEYLNYENEMRILFSRLKAGSPEDYLRKLVARRTTENGIFGIKSHFHHFKAALVQNPGLLRALHPVRFVYINRRDELAQAVSLAKAFQTRAWVSLVPPARVRLFYDQTFIGDCLEEVRSQKREWEQWFEEHDVAPLRIAYEDLLGGQSEVVGRVLDLLGVRNDLPTRTCLPEIEAQSDGTNAAWIARYRAEATLSKGECSE